MISHSVFVPCFPACNFYERTTWIIPECMQLPILQWNNVNGRTPANQLRLVVDPSLVISPHLKKYARQIGSFPQTKGENKTYSWNQNAQKSHCEPRVFTRSATNPRVPWPVVLGVNRWCWRRCNCSSGLGWNSIIGNVAEGPGAMFLENDDNTTPGWWF